MNHFKGKQFQQGVIIVAVGYYLRYNLSYREVQEILYDRGINVSHTTIYRWVQEYGKLLYQNWKKKNKKSFYSWKWYLYRAIDADGLTLDIWLRKKRDTQATYAFLKRLVKQFDEPKVVVTDKAPLLQVPLTSSRDQNYSFLNYIVPNQIVRDNKKSPKDKKRYFIFRRLIMIFWLRSYPDKDR
ncbi:IS6 family transposase [Ligilactobacillus faecis]|uniref:IS6 family transposase n=1 Tax=Ligilactobacillus faecis TaxID=762833 RepID=A0ABV4DRU2_9LACO